MNSMSQQVFKYRFNYMDGPGPITLKLPEGAKFLSAQNQYGQLVGWFLINTDNPEVEKKFYLLETGKEYPTHHRYLATIQLELGDYVIHLLEKQP